MEEHTETRASQDGTPADPTPELLRLLELTAKYPEIGPPLAELAFKIGQAEVGNRVLRLGMGGEGPGLEYHFVAANVARREERYGDLLRQVLEAVRAYASAADSALVPDDGNRVLHLVRLGFATLLFELKDPNADPAFVQGLAAELLRLEPRLGADPFYRSLVAQTLWYQDRERSEQEWERATKLADRELTWNARGTWYKDAERDPEKAARAYRQGLEQAPASALLRHNLAQALLDMAEQPSGEIDEKRRLFKEAEALLRDALRQESPKGLRRHIHSTRDRLQTLRNALPARVACAEEAAPERLPEVGEVLKGRIVSLTTYGAFVSMAGRGVGLLHKTAMAHEPVHDPAALYKVGDEVEVKVVEVEVKEGNRPRIGLSRKALLEPPAQAPASASDVRPSESRSERGRGGDRPRDNRERRAEQGRRPSGPGGRRSDRERDAKLASLGEMLLAKMREQQGKS